MSRRFVLVGSVLADVIVSVGALPRRGGDVLARSSQIAPGGGFNLLAATARQGMDSAYAGRVGDGAMGQMIAGALAREGVTQLLAQTSGGDSGFCVVMVDASGERTMLTAPGVDAHLTHEELASVSLREDDLLYISGYDLAYPHGAVLSHWLATLPPAAEIIFDPGPLVGEIPADRLSTALSRTSWLSLNLDEATALTGSSEAVDSGRRLVGRCPRLRGLIIRAGAQGCRYFDASGSGAPEGVVIPAFTTEMVDATGAGDCHVGVFAATLAAGVDPVQACARANAAAAIAVARPGPATAPTPSEIDRRLAAEDAG